MHDLVGWIADNEAMPANRVRRGEVMITTIVALLASSPPDAKQHSLDPVVRPSDLVMADLLDPNGLLPRLIARSDEDPIASRAALIDQLMPALRSLVQSEDALRSGPALSLCAERPTGLGVVVAALASNEGERRRAALRALTHREVALSAEESAIVAPAMRRSAADPDWRERHEALACLRQHPALAGPMPGASSIIEALVHDANPLVSQVGATLTSAVDEIR